MFPFFSDRKNQQRGRISRLELGAQDYIMKLFVRENLLTRIHLRLESSKQLRQLQILRERFLEIDTNDEWCSAFLRELTSAEKEVFRLVILGYKNQEISFQLNYAYRYVKNLVSNIYHKLGVGDRGDLLKLFRSLYRHEIEKIAGSVGLDFIVNAR